MLFRSGHSFTANPLGCVAALASLALLEAAPHRHSTMAERHRPHLQRLAEHPMVCRPRLTGCIAAFDLAGEGQGYLSAAGPALQRRVRRRGVFVRPLGDVVYLLPPLCIDDAQLAHCWDAIAEALDEGMAASG